MALIVENGSQVPDADSFVSVADADTIAAGYGITLDATDKETNLKIAYKWLLTLEERYQGERLDDIDTATSQTGAWPRKPVYIRGNLKADDNIPQELIDAQIWAAYAQETASILTPEIEDTTGAIKSARIEGALDVEYFQGSQVSGNDANASLQFAMGLLAPLFKTALQAQGGGLKVVKNYS